MRKITVLFLLAFALAWAPVAHAQLSFNADFAQDTAYETSWPIEAGDVVSVDVYVSNVPAPGLISMGFTLEYDATKLSVEGAVVDVTAWPGGFVDTTRAGEVDVAGFRTGSGLAGDSIRLGSITFRCLAEGTSALMVMDRDGDWFVLDDDPDDPTVLDGDIGDGVLLATILPPILGDVNGDGLVNLADAIVVLKVMAKMGQGEVVHTTGDVNGDGKIGLAEASYVVQKAAGLR